MQASQPAPSSPPPRTSATTASDAAPHRSPSGARSAILPLGLATAGLAGLLLWLGSSSPEDSAPLVAPAPPANVAAREPELRPLVAPGDDARAATPPAAPTTAAEPARGDDAPAPADSAPTEAAETGAPAAETGAPAAETATAAPANDAPPSTPEPGADAAPAEGSEPERAPGATSADAGSEPVPSDEGLTEGPVTTIYMAPDCAELYRRGKRVGRSGVRVRTPAGKQRVYEVVCPGHGTRKLTLDGTRSEVSIGLRRTR